MVKNKIKRYCRAYGVSILLPFFILNAYGQDLKVGMSAPPIRVSQWVKGTPISKFEPGEIYVVEFWATWCGPCKQSIPLLTKEAKKLAGKVTFIGISVAENDTAKVEPFVREMGDKMDYNIAIDDQASPIARTGAMNKAWMAAAGQNGIPTAFIVGKTGRVEFIGSPFVMDTVLDQVAEGTFDPAAYEKSLEAKAAEQKAAAEKRKADDEAWKKTPLGMQWQKFNSFVAAKDYAQALKELDVLAAMKGDAKIPSPSGIRTQLRWQIFRRSGDMDGYYEEGEKLYQEYKEKHDGFSLNGNLAWPIVDPGSTLKRKDYDFALKAALASVEAFKRRDCPSLDTLAWAYHWKGNKALAVSTEEEAVKLATAQPSYPEGMVNEYKDTVKKFQASGSSN